MKMPNCSNMMRVGQLRHIQSCFEDGDLRNPDNLADLFLSPSQKMACLWRALLRMSRLRADPFYSFLLARTRYYDGLFVAAAKGVYDVIVNIGCGSDTRAFRFEPVLRTEKVRVVECDQPAAIFNKQNLARKKWDAHDVSYLPMDLNLRQWGELEQWLQTNGNGPVFILMEGVSPYITRDSFGSLLDFLSRVLPPGSRMAYDFKIQGVADHFGSSGGNGDLFRLPAERGPVAEYHRVHGFILDRMETSEDLTVRMLGASGTNGPVFREDVLLQIEVAKKMEGP